MVFPSTEDTVLEGSLANLPAQITVPTGIFRERMAGRRKHYVVYLGLIITSIQCHM